MRNLLLFLATLFFTNSALAQCQANFTFSSTNLMASFNNTSTPVSGTSTTIVGKMINFGDSPNWYGFYTNPTTHTYSSAGTYVVKVKITVFDSLTLTYTCVDSISKMVSVNYAPCATSISKTQNGNFVTFTANNLAGTPGMTYNWNFGDGNTGTGSPVSHTYNTTGSFTVSLTAVSSSASCTTSVNTSVSVTTTTNIISGHIIADSTQADTFKVWLIKFDSSTNNLYAVDSLVVSNNPLQDAYYAFNNKTAGVYRTKAAQLDGPTSGTGYVPTYHTSSLYWNSATLINHGGSWSGNKDIYMKMGTVTSGPGFVGGNVTLGANKGTGGGIEGTLIFLRDVSQNLVSYTYTDANGDYSFANLPTGAYSVYPEEGGFTTTPATLILTATNPAAGNVGFERHNVSKTIVPKTTGLKDLSADKTFNVYPNPSNGILTVNVQSGNTHTMITVRDIAGRNVFQQDVNLVSGKAEINLQHLEAGAYFISVTGADMTAGKILVINK